MEKLKKFLSTFELHTEEGIEVYNGGIIYAVDLLTAEFILNFTRDKDDDKKNFFIIGEIIEIEKEVGEDKQNIINRIMDMLKNLDDDEIDS